MIIREARITDQDAISQLILTIINQMELPELQMMTDSEKIKLITSAYDLAKLLPYTSFVVAEIDNKVTGVSYSYAYDVEMQTHTDILAGTKGIDLHPNQEAWPNEWYLEMLSVDTNYRGHGIGKALMAASETIAKQQGFLNISLNVDNENPRAEKLYQLQGYQTEKEILIGQHAYKHMLKTLK
ncbi:GNAT family N-acetyltransferase [Periweissella fabaria]|uniref:N-acetyltransferase domain-containing protein n=1 Tax=Periweissella fabaria TaxID=546157 RepID=A0ABN8BEX3_9LACO|nr:GNAT family N-acetyltransferase [Periweissella fabaria]MCM0596769.1 GNAT family N-acetyltransferase [Periweissella fabaria]CAH0416305.1 hypothetical protein WFA24289_00607 [Periweissella fabaria]